MKSKTNNQIREEVRKRLASKYSADLENAKKRYSECWDKYVEEEKKVVQLTHENNELKQKLEALEDWNRRLLEFMDMPEAERKEAYAQYIESKNLNKALDNFLSPFLGMYSNLFG